MPGHLRCRLLTKLVVSNLLTAGVAVAVVGAAVHVLAAKYFMTLVEKYDIAPDEANRMFLEAVQRYLFGAGLLACALAVGVGYWLTRKILTPLDRIRESAAKVAAGNYSARVRRTSHDEIGDLADAFNGMAESLLRVERLRKEMVANVAHELRTPLTNVRGYLEGLIDGVVPPSRATFESLHEETLRLVRLVEDVLQLARADAAPRAMERRPVRLDQSAAQAVELFRLKFAEKGIAVETELAAELGVSAEEGRTCQMMINLLENAWRYTPSGGRVRVAAERVGPAARVTVSNTAEGLTKAEIGSAFERFYRGEKSRSREYGGAGIGLAIVKDLVEAHDGGVGSEFADGMVRIWFELPLDPVAVREPTGRPRISDLSAARPRRSP